MTFDELVAQIPQIGLAHHREAICRNSFRNATHITKTVRDISPIQDKTLVVCAGPSLYRKSLLSRLDEKCKATIIATDGAYIQCLKHGITPDFVITLDPHPTRMVRWFGDPEFAANSKDDTYFSRTKADWGFAEDRNAEDMALVDSRRVPLIISTTAPENVVARTSAFDRYWFAPLVDDPQTGEMTKVIVSMTGCPALNTGGTVGTAAWNFAHSVLRSKDIAVIGMDLGYFDDLPLSRTQEYNLLAAHENIEELFPYMHTPHGRCRTSPTYAWYQRNMLELLESADARITNCSEHGILFGDRVRQMRIEEWMDA